MNRQNNRFKITGNRMLSLVFVLILGFFCIKNSNAVFSMVSLAAENGAGDIPSVIDAFEKEYNKEFFMKYFFVDANGFVHSLLGQRIMNKVIKLNNGYLAKSVKNKNVSPYARNMIVLNDYLSKKGIPLLYVQAPYKISKYDDQLPAGVKDYSNKNADKLLKLLAEGGVDTLDLRSVIRADGIDHYSLFFRTDHHWTVEASFWAYAKTMDVINDKYGFNVDGKYTDINNYTVKVYEDWFLGSWGKKTGTTFAGTDDISLITPNFPTSLSLAIPSENIVREGDFSDAIYVMERIQPKDYFNNACYEVYLGGQYPLITIKNNIAENDKKILLVLDSFARPVGSFMSACFKETDIIDLRKFTDGNLKGYIEETRPDLVVFFYNPDSLYDAFFDY